MNSYTIGEVAKISGLASHTLRYYESREIILVKRDQQNRRIYSKEDLKWLEVVVLLKSMGLSLKQLKEYSKVYYQETFKGDALAILSKQKEILHKQKEIIRKQINRVELKINLLKTSADYVNLCENKRLK